MEASSWKVEEKSPNTSTVILPRAIRTKVKFSLAAMKSSITQIGLMEALVERLFLEPDFARAARAAVAFLVGLSICFAMGHWEAAPFVATAAQVLAMPNLRGDYAVRLA